MEIHVERYYGRYKTCKTSMKIAIYCVNYNSYDSLTNYLHSIDNAAEMSGSGIDLSVFVADNTVPAKQVVYQPAHFALHILSTAKNLGYFGAVNALMQQYPPVIYDYTIISNVDVLLTDVFFKKLKTVQCNNNIGWIAPQIYSKQEQRDRNPKILQRYSKKKLQILHWLFRFPVLYNLYTHTIYKTKKIAHHQPGCIYAGHGSFIILTKHYFEKCSIIDYPMFLFCEEIYLGEQCRQNGLKVIYNPTIIVNDNEHASTGAFRRSLYCKYNFEATGYIIKTYY